MPAALAPSPTAAPRPTAASRYARVGSDFANLRAAADAAFPEGEFKTLRDVPVFAEHQTQAGDGRQLSFGYDELSAIAERCNRRIRETGDYAVLCMGHTPSREARSMGAPSPKPVGYAGPFQVQLMGNDGQRQRYAITSDLHIFADDWPEARKHSRRSSELWVEDSYDEMFLDPIALLGAEPPRLDLGLVYSRQNEGKQVLKYAAVYGGPESVHVAGSDDQTKHFQADEAEGDAMAHDPNLVREIVDAICELPHFKWVEEQMAKESGVTDGVPGAEPPVAAGPAGPAPPPAPPAPAAMDPPPAPPAPPVTQEPPAPPSAEGSPDDEKEKEMPFQKSMYAALDSLSDDELEQYMAGRRKRHAAQYQAEGTIDSDEEPTAEAGTYGQTADQGEGVDGSKHAGSGDSGLPGPETSEQPMQNAKSGTPIKYQMDQLQLRLRKLEKEREEERIRATDAERRARLLQYQHEGFVLDVDKAMERLCYAKVRDDAHFDSMLELFLDRVPQAPLGRDLPVTDPSPAAVSHKRLSGARGGQTQKYSREEIADARKRAVAWIEANPHLDSTGRLEYELSQIRPSANGQAVGAA